MQGGELVVAGRLSTRSTDTGKMEEEEGQGSLNFAKPKTTLTAILLHTVLKRPDIRGRDREVLTLPNQRRHS